MKSVLVLALCLTFVAAQTNPVILDSTYADGYFTVTDDIKTSQHPYFQQGFPIGYVVNGTQGATLKITAGNTYTFKVVSQCNHPFYFSLNPSGQNLSQITEGVTTPDYEKVCGGAIVTWVPSAALIGQEIFYQCRTHSKMGFKIIVVAETFCNKYSKATQNTNEQLVTAVVNNVFTVAVSPSSPLLDYFNGRFNPTHINYTDPARATDTQRLAANLVGFFGIALGCTDPAFPPYRGVTNMATVHAGMPIAPVEFNTFNAVVLQEMQKLGVTDQKDLAAVLAVLNSLQPDICNVATECKNSICDRYSRLLNVTNEQLVTKVVVETFGKAIATGSPIRGFFDGTIPRGSTNFIPAGTEQSRLVRNLVAFFGQSGILTCTDANYPVYSLTATLKQIHAAMPIGTREFTVFNGALVAVLAENGVAPADQTAVATLLESTKPDICNLPDCRGVQPAGPDVIFAVDVVPKKDHPNFNRGFPSGFRIDGVEGRELFLDVGKTYAFRNTQGCLHPLYITTSDIGIGAGGNVSGVTYPQGDVTKGCGGADVVFQPESSQMGTQLYYQCQNHDYMGYKINIGVRPTFSTQVPTLPTTGVPATTEAEVSSLGGSLVPAIVTLLLVALLL